MAVDSRVFQRQRPYQSCVVVRRIIGHEVDQENVNVNENGDDDDARDDVPDEEDAVEVEDETMDDDHAAEEPQRLQHCVKDAPEAVEDEVPFRGAFPGPDSWLNKKNKYRSSKDLA